MWPGLRPAHGPTVAVAVRPSHVQCPACFVYCIPVSSRPKKENNVASLPLHSSVSRGLRRYRAFVIGRRKCAWAGDRQWEGPTREEAGDGQDNGNVNGSALSSGFDASDGPQPSTTSLSSPDSSARPTTARRASPLINWTPSKLPDPAPGASIGPTIQGAGGQELAIDWEAELERRLAWLPYRQKAEQDAIGSDYRWYSGPDLCRTEVEGEEVVDPVLFVKAFLEVWSPETSSYVSPLSPHFNPSAFLWKKLDAIPDKDKWRLVEELEPRHIKLMWHLARNRFRYPIVMKEWPALFDFPNPERGPFLLPYVWEGRVCGVPSRFLNRFQKVFFVASDGNIYGRVVGVSTTTSPWLRHLADSQFPLYFRVDEVTRVIATDEPAELRLRYDDGHVVLKELGVPQGFPQPRPPPYPFSDVVRDYLRPAGKGVLVGQAWQEGADPGRPPTKFLGEFVLVRRPLTSQQLVALYGDMLRDKNHGLR